MSAVEAPTRSRTDTAAKSMAVLRIATGLLFLWAFADKAFGLGYATQSKNAWFSGGSPTKGFLSRVDVGPFESTFHAWAGTWWADLLFMAGGGRIRRLHGPFVTDAEVERVVDMLKAQGAPQYRQDVTEDPNENGDDDNPELFDTAANDDADLFDRAVEIVRRDRKASTSYLQRRLQIGYNRAATLIERMEKEGVISTANAAGKRDILLDVVDED